MNRHACIHLQNVPTVCVSFSLKLQRTWLIFLAWRNPLPLTTTWKLSVKKNKKEHLCITMVRNLVFSGPLECCEPFPVSDVLNLSSRSSTSCSWLIADSIFRCGCACMCGKTMTRSSGANGKSGAIHKYLRLCSCQKVCAYVCVCVCLWPLVSQRRL